MEGYFLATTNNLHDEEPIPFPNNSLDDDCETNLAPQGVNASVATVEEKQVEEDLVKMILQKRTEYIENGKNEILKTVRESFSFNNMMNHFTKNQKEFSFYITIKSELKSSEFYQNMLDGALDEWKSEFAQKYFNGNKEELERSFSIMFVDRNTTYFRMVFRFLFYVS